MIQKMESPALAATSVPGSEINIASIHSIKPLPKWKRVLRALLDGRTLNRFEAEHAVRDHCLHSTVAELESKGVRIDRREETVPGFGGCPTRVKRYQLAQESRQRAAELLGLPGYLGERDGAQGAI